MEYTALEKFNFQEYINPTVNHAIMIKMLVVRP